MLYIFYRLGKALVLTLPVEKSYKIAAFLADIYSFFAREDKKNLEHNLRIVLGKNDKELMRKHIKNIFRNFAKYLVDFFRFEKMDGEYVRKNIRIEGRENLDMALAKRKGAILLSAHIGNWELGAAAIAGLGYPLHALVLDHKDKRINDFFVRQRVLCNIDVIGLGGQLKNCFRVLKKKEALAIVGDRDFTESGIEADFFGRPAVLPKGAASFSLKTGAPIVPTFLIRKKDNTFKLIFEKAIEGKKTENKDSDVKHIMKRYLPAIEKYVKAFPDQWYVFKKIWA